MHRDLDALLAAAAETADVAPPPKRSRANSGRATSIPPHAFTPQVDYPTIVTRARAFFERFRDAERAAPMVWPRKRARPWQFNSPRLRML